MVESVVATKKRSSSAKKSTSKKRSTKKSTKKKSNRKGASIDAMDSSLKSVFPNSKSSKTKESLKQKFNLDIWTVAEIADLYGTKPNTIRSAEKDGRIPEPSYMKIRNLDTRVWTTKQLPEIGTTYGWLKKPKNMEMVTLAFFTIKGGMNKTSKSYITGRLFALNGFRVLLIGNDPQSSLTCSITAPYVANLSVDQLEEFYDLSDVMMDVVPLEKAIVSTDLPNLDLLPETDDLEDFGNELTAKVMLDAGSGKNHRNVYQYYSDLLLPKIKEAGYDLVIFDNGPSLTTLNKNSLYACDYWITPNACDLGSILVFEKNFNRVLDFGDEAKKEWKDILLIPTMKSNTIFSNDVHNRFKSLFPEFITECDISKRVGVEKSLSHAVTPNEAFVGSSMATEYKNLSAEIWERICKSSSK